MTIDLKQWRKARGLTQEGAALQLGLSWRQYQRLEAGHCKLSGSVERLLAIL
jgi:transcriptional regulator with XRE-family HTH domain